MFSRDAFNLSDLNLTHSTRFLRVDQKSRIRGYYRTADDSAMRPLPAGIRQSQTEKG